jgi:hypothetical protein
MRYYEDHNRNLYKYASDVGGFYKEADVTGEQRASEAQDAIGDKWRSWFNEKTIKDMEDGCDKESQEYKVWCDEWKTREPKLKWLLKYQDGYKNFRNDSMKYDIIKRFDRKKIVKVGGNATLFN